MAQLVLLALVTVAASAAVVTPLTARGTLPRNHVATANLSFPPQFRANFSIAAHLVDRTKQYPPWKRRVEVWYDGIDRKVKAYVHEGFEAGKLFLRRYDTKNEYTLRFDEFEECRRSFLSEPLEEPVFPGDFQPRTGDLGRASVGGRATTVLSRRDDYERVKVYVDVESGIPISITDEYNNDGEFEPVMTWTIENIVVGQPDPAEFELPASWSHQRCKRHIGGWPYIHLFHHYFKA